jgi:hypothetical protein
MAPQFYDFHLWPLRNTAWPPGGAIWPPLRTTVLNDRKEGRQIPDDGPCPQTENPLESRSKLWMCLNACSIFPLYSDVRILPPCSLPHQSALRGCGDQPVGSDASARTGPPATTSAGTASVLTAGGAPCKSFGITSSYHFLAVISDILHCLGFFEHNLPETVSVSGDRNWRFPTAPTEYETLILYT